MIRVSLVNHLESAASISAVSEAPNYPATRVAVATHPFIPYRSGAAGAGQKITIDLGSAKAVDMIGLGRLNFTSVTVRADDSASFNSDGGNPQFSQALTAAATLNTRYHAGYRPPATVTRRHWQIEIANQTPVATLPHAGGVGFYLVGWIWLGPLAVVPRDILMEPELERLHPVEDLVLPSGVRQRSEMGPPAVTLTARRVAEQDAGRLATQLRQWLALDAAWRTAGYGLVMPTDTVPSDAFVMRHLTNPKFSVGRVLARGDLALEEIAG